MRITILISLILTAGFIVGCNGNMAQGEVAKPTGPTLGFEEEAMTLNVGETIKLSLIEGETALEILFKSSNEDIAVVTNDGTVTAVSEGTVIITSNMGNMSAVLSITVVQARVIELMLERNVFSLGQTVEFDIVMIPDDGASYTVSFMAEDAPDMEPVAIMNNSFVVNTTGMHRITAVSGDAVASIQLIVFDITEFAVELFELTNAEREKAGVPALIHDPDLDAAATIRVTELDKLFSHTRPDGQHFASAFYEAEVTAGPWGENLAFSKRTPEEVIDGWMNSVPHREAMLDPKYTHLGIGVHMTDDGDTFWVQTFRAGE